MRVARLTIESVLFRQGSFQPTIMLFQPLAILSIAIRYFFLHFSATKLLLSIALLVFLLPIRTSLIPFSTMLVLILNKISQMIYIPHFQIVYYSIPSYILIILFIIYLRVALVIFLNSFKFLNSHLFFYKSMNGNSFSFIHSTIENLLIPIYQYIYTLDIIFLQIHRQSYEDINILFP